MEQDCNNLILSGYHDSNFEILERLSYRDLIKLPTCSKSYARFGRTIQYRNLVHRKYNQILDKVNGIIFDNLWSVVNSGGAIWFDPTIEHKRVMYSGSKSIESNPNYNTIYYSDNSGVISISQHELRDIIMDKIKNLSTFMIIEDSLSDLNYSDINIKQFWYTLPLVTIHHYKGIYEEDELFIDLKVIIPMLINREIYG